MKSRGTLAVALAGMLVGITVLAATEAGQAAASAARPAKLTLTLQRRDVWVGKDDLVIAAGHYVPADNPPPAISSWGQPAQQEQWNLVRARKITHLLYIGDTANCCVFGREFGMLQMRWLKGGLSPQVMPDGRHPSARGYEIRAAALEPELAKMVGGLPGAGTKDGRGGTGE